MNLRSVGRRIAAGELYYALGRFRTVRLAYSRLQGLRDRIFQRPPQPPRATLFEAVDVRQIVQTIRDEAVYIGFNLPLRLVSEIEAFGRSQPLRSRNHPEGVTFFYSEVRRGYTAEGLPAPLGGIRDPARCDAVAQVMRDPVLLAIVREYLGYEPRSIVPILDWTFAADFSDDDRRKYRHHVIDYHYDVGGFNFVFANFYIVDTDRYSGAHVMMRRSHKRKPLWMLLRSAVATPDEVYGEYGAENEITIEGPAGTGFIQDASCFHRATSPSRGDRLLLAIRFS